MQKMLLRNGSEELKPAVQAIMMTLNNLWESGLPGMLAVCDLREIALGKSIPVSADTIQRLQDSKLLEPNGQIHQTVRNIVVSACEGEGGHMTLSSPLARADTRVAGTPPPKSTNG